MIDPKAITTYAQYNEDIILLALFEGVAKGLYVDVGANSPIIDSVTKIFYDKGWRGINLEPMQKFYGQLQKARPKDINLQIGAGEKSGTASFREYPKHHGLSTFTGLQKEEYGQKYPYKDYDIKVMPLKDILAEHKVSYIHFLKIDAEGYEYEVIAGNDWHKYRPEVICVEANHMIKDWRPILTQNNYHLFIADGLNEYYIAKEAWGRTKGFAERVIKLDSHALKHHQYRSWSSDSKRLKSLTKLVQAQHEQLAGVHAELNRIAALSLVDQPLKVRLKRVAKGLTTDWRQYKKQSKK